MAGAGAARSERTCGNGVPQARSFASGTVQAFASRPGWAFHMARSVPGRLHGCLRPLARPGNGQ